MKIECFPCNHTADYDAESYRWFKREGNMLCEMHNKLADEKIAEKEKKTYVVKTKPAAYVPPMPKKEFKNYQEREVGEEG